MKSIRIISLMMVLALGITPMMTLSTQATVTGTQILDSQANILGFDFSGDYVSYVNSVDSGYPTDVVLYNWKTSTAQTIYTSSNVGYGTSMDGNYVLFQDRATPSTSKLIVYDISSSSTTTIGTFSAFSEMHMAIGDGYVVYTDNMNNENFVRVKTVSGSTVWSRNVTGEYVYGFNINHGYVMYSGDAGVNVYNTATGSFFTINQASDVFMTDQADTDGTTIIFTEVGDYPNEFTRIVAYDIATQTKKTFSVPGSASQFRIDNGKIYYADGTSGHDSIYWMNIDGTGVEQISDSDVGNGLVVENGKAVIMDPADWSILYMYDTAGMGGTGTTPPTTGNVIGTTGGTITRDGAVLDIPADSLSGDVDFSLDKLTVDNENVLSAFQLLPNDIVFNPPATLTLDIPGTRAAGNELMRLEDGQWVAQDSTPSADGSSLIAQISQTGSYAITVARDTMAQTIDAAGGVVSIPDVSLNIPADALASSALVTVEETFVDASNVAQAVAVDIGNTVLSVPAQLSFNIPATVNQADAVVGHLVGNSWMEVESTVNSAGQIVADITEGGVYALMELSAGTDSIIPGIPFPSGMTLLAIMLSTGLAVAVVRRRNHMR